MKEWVGSDIFLKQPESDTLMRNILQAVMGKWAWLLLEEKVAWGAEQQEKERQLGEKRARGRKLVRSLGRTRENGRFRGSFSESDREVRRRSKVLWKVGTMVWRNAYMSLIFSPLSLSVSWLALVLVRFLEVEVRVVVEQGDLSSVVIVLGAVEGHC